MKSDITLILFSGNIHITDGAESCPRSCPKVSEPVCASDGIIYGEILF